MADTGCTTDTGAWAKATTICGARCTTEAGRHSGLGLQSTHATWSEQEGGRGRGVGLTPALERRCALSQVRGLVPVGVWCPRGYGTQGCVWEGRAGMLT